MVSFVNLLALICLAFTYAASEVLEYPTIRFKKAFQCKKANSELVGTTSRVGSPQTTANWTEKIVINADKLTMKNSTRPGCYSVAVPLSVKANVAAKMYSRFLIRVGSMKLEPLECTRNITEKTQCREGFGSCIFCDICKDFHDKTADGKAIGCPLAVGSYSLVHELCVPKAGEFLDNIPTALQKTLELEKDTTKANPYAVRDFSFHMQLFETDIFGLCGLYDKPLDCLIDLTPQMIGCITVLGSVRLKVVREISQITAPTRPNTPHPTLTAKKP